MRQTRRLPRRWTHRSVVSPSADWALECVRVSHEGSDVNHWAIARERRSTVALEAVTAELRARLTALGSRCDEVEVVGSRADFLEWLRTAGP